MSNWECKSQVKVSVNSHTKPHQQYNDNTTTVRLMKTAKKYIIIIRLKMLP